MPENLIYIDEFVRKLRNEVNIRLTWLIGAGMSASAGIPLAAEVSKRVILFDYLCNESSEDEGVGKLFYTKNENSITYADFDNFLDWYDTQSRNDSSGLQILISKATEELGKKPDFKGISVENRQCYPLLFAKMFLSDDNAHRVLTAIVRRAKGVNLAHLALAGLMRDFPDVGHTVFTTNFDDLLLKAFLSLNHTARVFGELKSQDRPVLQPTYPQIVHLHGRHTGYRLANTEQQFKQIDPNIRYGFLEHLRGSHLLVVGYSGWDDMAMSVLREWQQDDNLLRGLFWVPYLREDTMLDEIRTFLAACPPQRAHVIVNEDRTLDADSFMLAMCRAINRKDGFQAYRNGLIRYAEKQHSFTLDQLKAHPSDDPLQAIELAKSALKHIASGRIGEARKCVVDAKKRIGTDLPSTTRATALLLVGTSEMLLENFSVAEEDLLNALPLWENGGPREPIELGCFKNHMALGYVSLRSGKLDAAKQFFVEARRIADRIGDHEGKAKALYALGSVILRYDASMASMNFKHALELVPANSNLLRAEIQRHYADANCIASKRREAREKYQEAQATYRKLGDDVGEATILRCLGSLAVGHDPDEAQSLLDQAYQIFLKNHYEPGVASVEQSRGDLSVKREDLGQAIEHYERAHAIYDRMKYRHAVVNLAADLLLRRHQHRKKDGTDASDPDLLLQLQTLANTSGNHYASNIVAALQKQDPTSARIEDTPGGVRSDQSSHEQRGESDAQ